MSSLGGAIVAKLQTANGIKTFPVQLPDKTLVDDVDYAVTYSILPGEGPLPTHDPAYDSGTRMERVRVQLSVWSRTYTVVESVSNRLVWLLDRVSQATWGTVKVQSSLVIGWLDAPMEPETSIMQRVIDVEVQYNEVSL